MEIKVNQIVRFYPKGKKYSKMFLSKVVEVKPDRILIKHEESVYDVKKTKMYQCIDFSRENLLNAIIRIKFQTNNFKQDKWNDFLICNTHISEFSFDGVPTDDYLYDIYCEIVHYHINIENIINGEIIYKPL